MKLLKKIDYRHYLCVGLTGGVIACSALLFPHALGRVVESFRDFGLSFAYYFCQLLNIDATITPTVNAFPKIPFFKSAHSNVVPPPSVSISETASGFAVQWSAYWKLWANADNFIDYIAAVGNGIYIFFQVLLCVIPLLIAVYMLFKRYLKKQNNDYGKKSKPLRAWERVEKRVYQPIRNWFQTFFGFVRYYKAYWIIWLAVAVFSFNLITIAVEFIAYYLYFVVSFDVVNLYRQVYKLFFDLSVLWVVPWWIWVVVGLVLFDWFRKDIAYARLNHYERRDRGFLNARPLVLMSCGSMGKKKTTIITDMALSQNIMFRDKAFEMILENDLKFPNFPWVVFERYLRQAIERHSVYNLATCKRFVRSKRKKFERRPIPYYCFGYDFRHYPVTYNDDLKVVDLWQVLETYAQLYFVYVMQSSLLISNYSIRTDEILSDLGNFPMWNADFFKRDSRLLDSYSRHAHILDFDALRLGTKMQANSKYRDSFEFGVIVITEIGKERKNNLELQGIKAIDLDANQKNDLFNARLKMIRHSATIDNYPFVRVITDEQRPESWGADARDLCDIVQIVNSGETRLAMPFFTIGELLYSLVMNCFGSVYYRYRYNRADDTLLIHLYHRFAALVYRYYTRIYNRFGYCVMDLEIESGRMDRKPAQANYYLMSKKIYSKRFSTDCFSDYFAEKSLRSDVGLNDVPEYKTERATFEEMRQQHSYFVEDMQNCDEENEKARQKSKKKK